MDSYIDTNRFVFPISVGNNICTLHSIITDNELYSYSDIKEELQELSERITSLKGNIKELIVATPKDLFVDNECGTVKEQLDEASDDLFSALHRACAEYERLYVLQVMLEEIAEQIDQPVNKVFELFIKNVLDNQNVIDYRYYNGDNIYNLQDMTVNDRTVSDMVDRALDNADIFNLNYNNTLTDFNKNKFVIRIYNSKDNNYQLYVSPKGKIFYDLEEDAKFAVLNNILNIHTSNYITYNYIKNHKDMFTNVDYDGFLKSAISNKEEFIKEFIKKIYDDTSVRFNHQLNSDCAPLMSLLQSRLLSIINDILSDEKHINNLFNEYVKNHIDRNNEIPKELQNVLIKIIENFMDENLLNDINNLSDYSFLNKFIETAIYINLKKLYKIEQVF